jgi:predicted amidohydrolase YtcJ
MARDKKVEAVLVCRDHIIALGSFADCLKYSKEDHKVVDLAGRCLIPGFVDPHTHPLMLGLSKIWADVSYPAVKCIDDLVSVLRTHAELAPGEPIRGYGFDQRKLAEARYPTCSDLDRVSTEVDVQIMHISGHCNVCNSHLLDRIGAKVMVHDPPGGALGRDQNGIPNGPLFDSAADLLSGLSGVRPGKHGPNIHMPDDAANLMRQFEVGQRLFLKGGVTAVNEVQLSGQELNTYLRAQRQNTLKLRIEMSWLSNYLDELINLGFNGSFGNQFLTIGSIKFYSDASLLSGTAHLSTGYRDSERRRGYRYLEEEEITSLIVKAHSAGFQTLTHAQGDLAIESVLNAVEAAQKHYPRPEMRHRIEHCGLPTEQQCQRMAELNVWPVLQVEMNYLYGDGIISGVGEEIGSNFSPMGWFRKYGVNWALSSDAPVTAPCPLKAIHAATTRKTILGNTIGIHQKASLQEAFNACTIDAAKAIRREADLGSLEQGKLADFAVLSSDPFQLEESEYDALRDMFVVQTWIAGEKVFDLEDEN